VSSAGDSIGSSFASRSASGGSVARSPPFAGPFGAAAARSAAASVRRGGASSLIVRSGARATGKKQDVEPSGTTSWDASRGGAPRVVAPRGARRATLRSVTFTPLGLDHVVLRVRDQARSRRFYEEVLGCTLDRVNEKLSLVQLRFGDHLIDLLPAGPGEPSGGLDHVCLSIRCEDLEDVARALAQKGVALEGGIVQRYGAYGNGPSLYLSDPDGYKIELKPRI